MPNPFYAADLQMRQLSGAADCQTVYQLAREVRAQVCGVDGSAEAKRLVTHVLSTNPDWKHVDTIDGQKYWEYLP